MKARIPALFVLLFALSMPGYAQWRQDPTTGSTPMRLPDRTNYAGMSGLGPMLEAELADEHRNAQDKRAVVKAEVWGVDLINPPQSGVAIKRSEAYLSYRLDQQPEVKTTDKEQTFNNLPAGDHTIVVRLAYADGSPAGAPVTLKFNTK